MAIDVSILIPTCNRVGDAHKCLKRLGLAISAAPDVSCEVILGNDGPPQDLESILIDDFPCPLRVSQGPRKGPAFNRNHLADEATGDLLLFIDDDVKPTIDLIAAYAKAQSTHPEVGIFEGRIFRESEPRYAHEEVVENETGGYLWTANLAVRRTVFLRLSGFDTDFPFAAMEDTEFRYRSQRAGIISIWCPEASVSHPITLRKGSLPYAKHRYSLLLFIAKYPEYVEAIKRDFSLIQCLRVLKFFIFTRSMIQPLDAYKSVFHRISSILITRHMLLHPSSIPAEMARMEAAMNIHPRGAAAIR